MFKMIWQPQQHDHHDNQHHQSVRKGWWWVCGWVGPLPSLNLLACPHPRHSWWSSCWWWGTREDWGQKEIESMCYCLQLFFVACIHFLQAAATSFPLPGQELAAATSPGKNLLRSSDWKVAKYFLQRMHSAPPRPPTLKPLHIFLPPVSNLCFESTQVHHCWILLRFPLLCVAVAHNSRANERQTDKYSSESSLLLSPPTQTNQLLKLVCTNSPRLP